MKRQFKSSLLFLLFFLLLSQVFPAAAQNSVSQGSSVLGPWQVNGAPELKGLFTFKISNIFIDKNIKYITTVDPVSNKNLVFVSNGEEWKSIGNPGISEPKACEPSITVKDGVVYYAFADKENKEKVTVMKYENSQWTVLGEPGLSKGKVGSLNLGFNGNDLYLAFQDAKSGFMGTVMKFNGTQWTLVGKAGFTGAGASSIRLTFDNSTPYVVYQDFSYKIDLL